MSNYESASKLMLKLFKKDCFFALATCNNERPTVRYVDLYFDGEAFYCVTYLNTKKMADILVNNNVALTSIKLYSFIGKAVLLGHPLEEKNSSIRSTLIDVFSKWYFKHNNENDENMCFLKIIPQTGFINGNGTGYTIDFVAKTAESFPFENDIIVSE